MRRAVVIVVLASLVAPAAFACPVCVGDTDSQMARGANNGMLFLLAVIFAVQAGFVALFVGIYRRAKRLRELEASFQLIEGGAR